MACPYNGRVGLFSGEPRSARGDEESRTASKTSERDSPISGVRGSDPNRTRNRTSLRSERQPE